MQIKLHNNYYPILYEITINSYETFLINNENLEKNN